MNSSENENSHYQIESPLNTGHLRKSILEIFPNYLDPICKEQRVKQCEKSIEELKVFLDENGSNSEVVNFVNQKLKIAIFQTPYPECFTLFEAFYNERYAEDLTEQQVSDFFPQCEIPSIQSLGYALFNDERECDKEGHGIEQSEEQKENHNITWPIIQNNVTNEELRQVLAEIYNNNSGRIPHLERLLCWFPDYLCHFHYLTQELFYGPGPIPLDQRYYIAILASSNFGCEYLHSRLSQQFLNIGGDRRWLEVGLEEVDDPKLQALAVFNSKLAYAPSEVCKNQQMIETLMESGWQKNELVQATFIITFYHGLACACQAMGLKSELDLRNSHFSLLSKTQTPIGSNLQSPKNRNSDDKQFYSKKTTFEFANSEIENILKRFTIAEGDQGSIIEEDQTLEKSNEPKKKSSSINIPRDETSSPLTKETPKEAENEPKMLQLRLFEKFKKFIMNPELRDKDERIPQTLRYSDFNYQTHGFQITNQYAYELAQNSKNILDIIKNMTNKNFNSSQNLSTTPFRKAIKLYIQNIFGYTHFDADYKTEMNALLPIPLKAVLKLTVKRPFEIKGNHISNINLKLMASEVAHIVLIAIHARFEIELVYFLYPFQQF